MKSKIIYRISIALLLVTVILITFVVISPKLNTPLWKYSSNTNILFNHVKISADGDYIVAAGFSNNGSEVYVFHSSSSIPLWKASINSTEISSLAISENASYFVVCTFDANKTYLFNRNSSIPLWVFESEEYAIYLDIDKYGNHITVGSGGPYESQGKIYFLNRSSPIPFWNYTTHSQFPRCSLSVDGSTLVSSSLGGFILVNTLNGSLIWKSTLGFPATDVKISDNGDYIAACYLFNRIALFNRQSNISLWNFQSGNVASEYHLEISSEGDNIITSFYDTLFYFQKSFSYPKWSYSGYGAVNSIDISSDGKLSAVIFNRKLMVFNKEGQIQWEYGANINVEDVAISSIGNLIVASGENSVYLFSKEAPFYNKIIQLSFLASLGLCSVFYIIRYKKIIAKREQIPKKENRI